MNRDFLVDQGNAIIKDGRIYELRNYYNFSGLEWDAITKTLKILFNPHQDFEDGNPPVQIQFKKAEFNHINIGFKPNSELDEIGFKAPSDDNLDYLSTESQSASSDHIVFRFTEESFIRVFAEYATLLELAL